MASSSIGWIWLIASVALMDHFSGDLFTAIAARFAADDIDGFATRNLGKASREDGSRLSRMGMTRQVDESGLDDFLRQLLRSDLAQRRE